MFYGNDAIFPQILLHLSGQAFLNESVVAYVMWIVAIAFGVALNVQAFFSFKKCMCMSCIVGSPVDAPTIVKRRGGPWTNSELFQGGFDVEVILERIWQASAALQND